MLFISLRYKSERKVTSSTGGVAMGTHGVRPLPVAVPSEPYGSFLIPYSLFLTPHSSFLISYSLFLIPYSSYFTSVHIQGFEKREVISLEFIFAWRAALLSDEAAATRVTFREETVMSGNSSEENFAT